MEYEIVICERCKGRGCFYEYVRVRLDDSDLVISTCETCKGTGRLIKKTEYEPYIERSNI